MAEMTKFGPRFGAPPALALAAIKLCLDDFEVSLDRRPLLPKFLVETDHFFPFPRSFSFFSRLRRAIFHTHTQSKIVFLSPLIKVACKT